ncbi:MAG: ABC transporter ATP-binding protein [Clostridiaceae bacterium]|nr:ABC transporter ATP-binding protein [Clostridiaceae bacterium]
MANAIELSGINKIYGTAIQTQVLFDIDLAFEEQSFNSIIGQSGSGKSTLMNIMGTLDRPTSGTVMIGGIQTSNMTKNDLAVVRNETIGFIFQFHYLLPEFTALENVLMPYLIKHNKPTAEVRERADELMELVGRSKVKNNKATEMSGGQQQRPALARALIMTPRIILADAPPGNLDSDTTEIIYDILRQVNGQFKTTFIIITHDRKIAEKADRIVEIRDGRISLDVTRPMI